MADALDSYPGFVGALRERLEAGRRTYGDRGFDRPPSELLAELECEALDLAGWGFVLFERIRRLRERVDATPAATESRPAAAEGNRP